MVDEVVAPVNQEAKVDARQYSVIRNIFATKENIWYLKRNILIPTLQMTQT